MNFNQAYQEMLNGKKSKDQAGEVIGLLKMEK